MPKTKDPMGRLDKLNILKSTFTFRNEAANTPYQLFLSHTDIRLAHLSNQRGEGTAIGTTVNISGTLHSPEYSTWQAFGGLLKNAFIKPLQPGFKKDPGPGPNSGLSSGSNGEAV